MAKRFYSVEVLVVCRLHFDVAATTEEKAKEAAKEIVNGDFPPAPVYERVYVTKVGKITKRQIKNLH